MADAGHTCRARTPRHGGTFLPVALLLLSSSGLAAGPANAARTEQLPDTVIARVGKGRYITSADLLRSWRESRPRAAQDSLTPAAARGFLELLIDRSLLAAEAARASWTLTLAETTRIAALSDRLAVAAALDSALREARAALSAASPGEAEPAPDDVGIAARDTAIARLRPEFDRALLQRLASIWAALPRASSDSSLAAQIRTLSAAPQVPAADTAGVLARSPVGDYRVSDLLAAWGSLSLAYRPRLDSAELMEDFVKNGLFERALRRDAERRRLAGRPEVAAAVTRLREDLAIEHYVRREILERLVPDTAAIEVFFRKHADDWALPTRLRAIRLNLDSRAQAGRTALLLRNAAEAESLAARALRAGLQYRVLASATSDSALFAAGMRAGPGTVVGPIEGPDGWWVARIEMVLPARQRALREVRREVEGRWLAEESERRIRSLCDRVAKRTPVLVNERALELLARP